MPLTADRAKPAVPFGGHLPADRLRAVQRRELRLPQDRRADAVQVAQPRPARHQDLADVDAARQLRHAGAGAAAGRQALVPRQRRRDLPVAQPDQRREARHRGRRRRRPRLPDGLLRRWSTQHIDSGAACTVAGDPAADRAGRPVRRDRRRPEDARADPRVPGEAEGPGRACPTRPDEVLASMGNYVFDADALRRGGDARRDARAAPSTTWAATSCRRSSTRGEAGVYDFKDNEVPGSTDRDRGYWRDVGTIGSYYAAHMDLVSPLPVFNLYNFEWPIYTELRPAAAGEARRGRRTASRSRRSTRSCRPAWWSPAARSARRCSRRRAGVDAGAEVSDSVLMNGVDGRRGAPWSATRSSTRTSWSRPAPQIGVDAGGRPGAASSSRTG